MSKLRSSALSSVAGISLALLAGALVAPTAGCKGGTTVKDNPDTIKKLGDLTTKLADKDTYIKTLESDLAACKLAAGGGNANEFVVTIQGDALEIKARPSGGGTPAVSDAVATELSQKFIELVRKSRGNITKCYEQALKKNASLQARTISLTGDRALRQPAATSPSRASSPDSLGTAFDGCMQGVAKNWKFPETASGMSFQSTVTLSPS
jgi:hypothetical protein